MTEEFQFVVRDGKMLKVYPVFMTKEDWSKTKNATINYEKIKKLVKSVEKGDLSSIKAFREIKTILKGPVDEMVKSAEDKFKA